MVLPLRPIQMLSKAIWDNIGRKYFSTPRPLNEFEREEQRVKRLIEMKERRAAEKLIIRAKVRPEEARGTKASVAMRKTGYVPGRLQVSV